MLPVRKTLPHAVPPWIPDSARFFITVNSLPRGIDQLNIDETPSRLLDSVHHYESTGKWYMHLFMIMPDHLHMIVSFAANPGMPSTMKAWKRFHAKRSGIEWQRDYFDHRLRNDNAFTEKYYYLLNNPVRKGLVVDWRDWPHKIVRGQWQGPRSFEVRVQEPALRRGR